MEGQKLLFPEAKVGLEYGGFKIAHEEKGLLPIYRNMFVANNYALVREYGADTYSHVDLKTFKIKPTKIGHILKNESRSKSWMSWDTDEIKHYQDYYIIAAFSLDRKTLFYLDQNGEIIKEIKNVNATVKANNIPLIFGKRHVLHKVGDRSYWQMYTDEGDKIGPELPSEKAALGYQTYGSRNASGRFIFEKVGDMMYKPFFTDGEDFTKSWKNKTGFYAVKFMASSKHKNHWDVSEIVFKDEKGFYFADKIDGSWEPNQVNGGRGLKKALYDNRKILLYRSKFTFKGTVVKDGVAEEKELKARELPDGRYITDYGGFISQKVVIYNSKEELLKSARMSEANIKLLISKQKKAMALAEKKRLNNERISAEVKKRADARRAREAAVANRARQSAINNKNRARFSDIDLTGGVSGDEATRIKNAKCRDQANRQNRHAGKIKYGCKSWKK